MRCCLFCLMWMMGCVNLLVAQEPVRYRPPVQLCELESKRVNESSGIASSQHTAGRFWTHNDSGDAPRMYCFDVAGKHLGTSQLKGAGAIDWEDMCSFKIGDTPKLLVADTGDNLARRRSCRLYLADEPSDPKKDIKKFQSIRLRYSTGPMDCEGVGVDSINQKLILVEKARWLTCRVFEADFPFDQQKHQLFDDGDANGLEIVAEPIGTIPLPLVTALDISPDGRHAIVLTLGQAFEFVRKEDESWRQAFARKPRTVDMPARRQGEAICYGFRGKDLYLTSELRPTPLFLVERVKEK